MCEREIAREDEWRITMAMKLAKFPVVRELGGFDFRAQPSVDEARIRDLATGRFIANGESVLFLGPPGVGKTHLAVGVGRGAILSGYTVLFTSAAALVASLAKAHRTGQLEEQLVHYTKPKLLIVDELGYLPLEVEASHLFFQLVSRRYEQGGLAHLEPTRHRMGPRLRRRCRGHRHPGPAAPPQPCDHHPGGKASDSAPSAAADSSAVSTNRTSPPVLPERPQPPPSNRDAHATPSGVDQF